MGYQHIHGQKNHFRLRFCYWTNWRARKQHQRRNYKNLWKYSMAQYL